MEKTKAKKIEELIENSDLSDEIKSNVYEFLIQAWENFDLDKHKIILSLPELTSKYFSLHRTAWLDVSSKLDYSWEVVPNSKTTQLVDFKSGRTRKALTKGSRISKSKVDDLAEINDKVAKITEKLSLFEKENVELKKIIFDYTFQDNLNEKIQYIPIDIYIDTLDNEKIFEVYSTVLDFVKNLGFIKAIELPAIKESWFKRIIAKSKDVMTSEQVMERFKEVEYGVEVNTILKQQSEIDKNESQALAYILKSLDGINNGAIRIGSLLVVKVTDSTTTDVNLQVRTLSIKEMYIINKNPNLLSKPQQVLEALSRAIEEDNKN